VNYAICGKQQYHLSPFEDCDCGLYARVRPDRRPSFNMLSGVIVANGRLMTARTGFRAEMAMIVALAMPHKFESGEVLASRIAEFYQVPLVGIEDLEAVAELYGVVPSIINPKKVKSSEDIQVKIREQREKEEAEVKLLTLVPEGPLLDVGVDPEVTRLRTIILMECRKSGGTTRAAITQKYWPCLAAGKTRFGTAERRARNDLESRLNSAFAYLRTSRFIVGTRLPTGGNVNMWRSTPDGNRVAVKGEYLHGLYEENIKNRHISFVTDPEARELGAKMALPPPGPVLALGNRQLVMRYRTVILQEVIDSAEAGATREDVRRKFWPQIPYYSTYSVSHYDRAQWFGYCDMTTAIDSAIEYLRREGYMYGTPRHDGGKGYVWYATDKARKLTVVGTYELPSPD
jgi:hypothetical protein